MRDQHGRLHLSSAGAHSEVRTTHKGRWGDVNFNRSRRLGERETYASLTPAGRSDYGRIWGREGRQYA